MCSEDCGCGSTTSINSTVGPRGKTGDKGDTGATGADGTNGTNGTSTSGTIFTSGTGTVLTSGQTGSTVYLNTAAGDEIALPTAPADGTFFHFDVQTSVTSNNYVISAGGSDTFTGYLFGSKVASDDSLFKASAALTDHTITMNGSTTGGLIGTSFTLTYQDAPNLWFVSGKTYGSAVLATPFS